MDEKASIIKVKEEDENLFAENRDQISFLLRLELWQREKRTLFPFTKSF